MFVLFLQVLSDSVAKALPLVVGEAASETALFTGVFDSFFDLLNVTNFTNGTRYRKPFQHPYRHAEDRRDDLPLTLRYMYNQLLYLRTPLHHYIIELELVDDLTDSTKGHYTLLLSCPIHVITVL